MLLFSQMTKMLDIIELFLEHLSMVISLTQEISANSTQDFARLDGATPVSDRQMIIDNFNEDKVSVNLI